jgi:hypothetical protein
MVIEFLPSLLCNLFYFFNNWKKLGLGGGLGHSDKGEFKYVVLFFQDILFLFHFTPVCSLIWVWLAALLLLDYALTFDMVDVE